MNKPLAFVLLSTLCQAWAIESKSTKLEGYLAAVDHDHDGRITRNELARYLEQRAQLHRDGKQLQASREAERQYNAAVDQYDKNGDNRLDWDELMADEWAMRSFATTEKNLKLMLSIADEDGDGKLTATEMLLMTHPDWSPRRKPFMQLMLAQFLDEWDQDKDGRIALPVFLEAESQLHVDYTEAEQLRSREQFQNFDMDLDEHLTEKELLPFIQLQHQPDDWDTEAGHLLNVIADSNDSEHIQLLKGISKDNIRANPDRFIKGLEQAARDEL